MERILDDLDTAMLLFSLQELCHPPHLCLPIQRGRSLHDIGLVIQVSDLDVSVTRRRGAHERSKRDPASL
jgi:hypothetical protein